MISEEDFATIDIRDPQMAFATLETRFRKALETNLENSQSNEAYNSYIIEYMNHTIAAARFLELDILQEWSVPSRNTSDLNEKYHAFITEVDYYKVQIRLAQLRTSIAYSVGLSGADKVKPWRDSNNSERLDVFNGLLLSPAYDAVFDMGLISFDAGGGIIFSEKLATADAKLLGLHTDARLSRLDPKHQPYLEHHRLSVFEG